MWGFAVPSQKWRCRISCRASERCCAAMSFTGSATTRGDLINTLLVVVERIRVDPTPSFTEPRRNRASGAPVGLQENAVGAVSARWLPLGRRQSIRLGDTTHRRRPDADLQGAVRFLLQRRV